MFVTKQIAFYVFRKLYATKVNCLWACHIYLSTIHLVEDIYIAVSELKFTRKTYIPFNFLTGIICWFNFIDISTHCSWEQKIGRLCGPWSCTLLSCWCSIYFENLGLILFSVYIIKPRHRKKDTFSCYVTYSSHN